MAERSLYNERFSFEDPCSIDSASRSTLYRRKKRARQSGESGEAFMEELPVGCSDVQDLEGLERDELEVEGVQNLGTEDESPPLYESEFLSDNLGDFDYENRDEDLDNASDAELSSVSTATRNTPTNTDGRAKDERMLYDCAPLTISSSNYLVLKYKLRHNLTNEAVADLLKLLALHCPTPNLCIYHLNKSFPELGIPITYHFYCTACLQSVNETDEMCPVCANSLVDLDSISYFTELDMETQLLKLFQRK